MIRTILNIKGGVGKTTTSINLARGLSNQGKRVLLIDLDGQANATSIITNNNNYSLSIVDCLLNPRLTKETIVKTDLGFDLLPSVLSLFVVEKKIMLDTTNPQHLRLWKVIKEIINDYDEIIVDCNPSLNILSNNAVFVCKEKLGEIIIPIKIDKGAIDGFKTTINFINEINENYDLDITYRVLLTMLNRNNLDKQIADEFKLLVDDKLFVTKIRNQSKPITEAGLNKKAVVDNAKTNVGIDYQSLVKEILEGSR
ncbi:MAG: ParA family protein [Erysipelotrichaceae bacterium]